MRRWGPGVVALLAVALLTPRCASAATRWAYDVTVDDALDRLTSKVCFDGTPPAALEPGLSRGAPYLVRAWRSADGSALPVQRSSGRIDTAALAAGSCVSYTIDLARLAARDHDARRQGAALLASPDLWLWRPPQIAADSRATVRFQLPPGFETCVPWPQPAGADGPYQLDKTAFDWTSKAVLGRFRRHVVEAAGARLDVAILPGARRATDAGIKRWLAASAGAVALVFGETPFPRAQVVVLPVGRSARPVVFGMAQRAGGPGLVLLLASDAGDDDLPGEWVAIHEMFHLAMPYVSITDAWLSEGVTMLYSETLQGRGGFISERAAWQLVHDGFERGRRARTGSTLAADSAAMGERGAYFRVYWGGAAIALAWDVALRRASGGRTTLDDALRHLQRCCRDQARVWRADEVLARLDTWFGSPLFSRIARPVLESPTFPAVAPLYRALGLEVTGERVRLSGDAAAATLRAGLAAPRGAR